jgi:hypothetical protein
MRTVRLRAKGLVTNPNKLDPDEGGLSTAANVVSERPGVIRPRRGFAAGVELATSRNFHKMFAFNGSVVCNWDDGAGTYKLSTFNGTNYTALTGTFRAPSSRKMRHAIVAENLYLTTNAGVIRMDDAGSTPEFAGAPAGIGFDRENSTLTTDTNGPLNTERQVAYRYCLSYETSQGRVIRGAPSGRTLMRNTSAADKKRPQVRALLPKKNGTASTALTTSYTLTVYRSSNSSSLTDAPPEDEAVVYEAKLTSAQITAGYVDVVDTTPDALRGSALPENAYNDGIAQSQYAPPYAEELVAWKGALMGFCTISRYRLEFQILSVLGSHGIQNTDEFTVSNGVVSFTVAGKTAPGASTDYQLENTGSAALDIELTAQNLCAAINRHASNTIVYAFYAGIPSDPRTLGKIVLEHRVAEGVTDFGINVSATDKTACFEPVLTTTYSDTPSTRDVWPDGWFISKPGAPDAVPLLNLDANFGRLGTGETVIRAVALEDSLFVFTDKSTWRVTGNPPTGAGDAGSLSFELFRSSLKCLASESAQVVSGAVYALTNQGVAAINDSGVRVTSFPIDEELSDALVHPSNGPDPATVESTSFAVGYDSDRKYILWVNALSLLTQAPVCYVYSVSTDSWTYWSPMYARCALVEPASDKLYRAMDNTGANSAVHIEKKTRGASDYTDGTDTAYTCTVSWLPIVEPAGVPKQFQEVQILFETSNAQPTTTVNTVSVPSLSTGIARTVVPQASQRAHVLHPTASLTAGDWAISGCVVKYRAYGDRVNE